MVEHYPNTPRVPDEVMSVIHDAAIEEDELRSKGARQERIKEKVGKKLAKRIIDLNLAGKDTSQAYPPEPEQPEKDKNDIRALTDEQWDRVDRMVDNGTMTYDEAIRRVRDH